MKYSAYDIAEALGKIIDKRAIDFLLLAFRKGDLEIIAGAHNFFIRRGESGTEKTLIEAFEKNGDVNMAEDFLNCGNAQLIEAARKWNAKYGCNIQHKENWSGFKWGQKD